MRIACVVINKAELTEEFAEACFRWTPQIALGEGAVFLEIQACRALYAESSLVARLQVLLKRFGLQGRIAIARDIPTALALASFRAEGREKLPIEALPFYYSPFHPSQGPLEKMLTALKSLGIGTLEEFRKIPRPTLVTKLGKEALVAVHHLEEAEKIPWPWFVPKEKLLEEESVDPSYQLTELEPITFLLKKILDRCVLRLRGKGRLATELRLRFELEGFSHVTEPKREWLFQLSLPQGSVQGLIAILRERLDREFQKKPLESGVIEVELEVIRSVPGQFRQADFFNKKEEEEESFRAVIARFTEKLGHDKVFFAELRESYFPERSWRRTLVEPQKKEVAVPERPLRVLKKPKPLSKVDNRLVHRRRRWRILSMEGPERMSGDWWNRDEERDYYRVKTEEGEELWVYTVAGDEQYFLHGIFD